MANLRLTAVPALALLLLAVLPLCSAQIPPEADCALPSTTLLAANSKTVTRGYYDLTKTPAAHVSTGDVITVEVVTHQATNDYAKMIKGDRGVEDIYYWAEGVNATAKNVPARPGAGVHYVTGPIFVCGGEVGDVLQVEILSLVPRKNPATGKTYGSNTASGIGYHQKVGTREGKNFTEQVTTIFEVTTDKYGTWGTPIYQFAQPKILGPDGKPGSPSAIIPHPSNIGLTDDSGNALPSTPVDYPPGFQSKLDQPAISYKNVSLDWRIPLRPHLGILGTMPANGDLYKNGAPAGTAGASTSPPSKFGGNVDDWRIGAGATLYYTCEVEGCNLVMADTHAAQGDSELDGSAIETSMTATLRLTLLKKAVLPPQLVGMKFPLAETREVLIVQGFAIEDYLSELPVPSQIAAVGGDLNAAFKQAYIKTRNFLMDAFYVTEDESIAIMSTAVDFAVTQVVDSNWGVHSIIRKEIFSRRSQSRKLLGTARMKLHNKQIIDLIWERGVRYGGLMRPKELSGR